MQSEMNYYKFDRAEWSQFHSQNFTNVTDEELAQLRSLNDEISLDDVKMIYSPLRHLIHIRYEDYQGDMFTLSRFLGMQRNPHTPFIIGIAGSVAVGKSTTARLLQLLLSRAYPEKRVQQMTTDGFLYPNAELERRGILDRKGFPESYDMELLIHFMNNVKNASGALRAPKYSHQIYDIVPGEYELIDRPDILIVEGINVLQLPSSSQSTSATTLISRFTLMPILTSLNNGIWSVSASCSTRPSRIRTTITINTRLATEPMPSQWRGKFGAM